MIPNLLTEPGPWPSGLVAAVVAGVLIAVAARRLRLGPASRAAATALYACAALLVELVSPTGVDGRAALLVVGAACLVVGGPVRNVLAALACVGAVLVAPVAAVAFLALLGAMALTGGLAGRLPATGRRVLGAAGLLGAVAVLAFLARPAFGLTLPPAALAVITLWVLLVTGLVWRRLRWLRPVGAAVLTLLVAAWLPGPDVDAVVLLAAVTAVLTVVLAEEYPVVLARRVLVATVAALAATAALLVPTAVLAPEPPTDGLRAAVIADLDSPDPTPEADPDPPPRPVEPVAPPLPLGPAGPPAAELGPPVPPPVPVRPVTISIPAIGLVAAPLGELIAEPGTGELSAPDDPRTAGWFTGGVVPGDGGPAVVGGHVDSRDGPGVFFALRDLRAGDAVEIVRSDGRTARFTVSAVGLYAKTSFPTAAVYGPTPGPELRLVTCGGPFDRAERSYEDNVVVEAVLT